jgi:tetratricopeptide (TPR) repeat protein
MKYLSFVCTLALAATALPALGAGSAPMEAPDEPKAKPETPAKRETSAKREAPAKRETPAKSESARKGESSAITAYNQGVELMQDKQFAQAQKKFEQAVKLDPNLAEAYNNLAFTLRKQGSKNYQRSLAFYNKAIELKPKLAEAYMYRGVLYSQMGRKADAQSDLALLKKLSPRLAKELEEYLKTGIEEDDLYGVAKKK